MEPLDSKPSTLKSEELKKSIPYNVVDLDSGEEIDIRAFDALAKSLLSKQPKYMFGALQDGEQKLKFIVASPKSGAEGTTPHAKIYFFDASLTDHAQFLHDFQEKHGEQELFAAGFLELTFSDTLAVSRRNLEGYSDSLRQFGLQKEASDEYKREALLPKLGRHFSAIDREPATSSS
jgi:hypothetical protein